MERLQSHGLLLICVFSPASRQQSYGTGVHVSQANPVCC